MEMQSLLSAFQSCGAYEKKEQTNKKKVQERQKREEKGSSEKGEHLRVCL